MAKKDHVAGLVVPIEEKMRRNGLNNTFIGNINIYFMKKLKSSTPQKMKAYASFMDWEAQESNTNPLTKFVSAYIQSSCPKRTTTVKRGQGCFLASGNPIAYIHTEHDHIQFGFYNGISLQDPYKVLEGKWKYIRHIKITTSEDIQEKHVDYFLNQLYK